jgi:hypothetical protein
LMGDRGFYVGCVYDGVGNYRTARIPDGARNASPNPSPRIQSEEQKKYKR